MGQALKFCTRCENQRGCDLCADLHEWIMEHLEAEKVVRCRDCKHWGDKDGKLQNPDGELFARCKVHNYLIDGRHTGWCPAENDFCSYGERKDGGAKCEN